VKGEREVEEEISGRKKEEGLQSAEIQNDRCEKIRKTASYTRKDKERKTRIGGGKEGRGVQGQRGRVLGVEKENQATKKLRARIKLGTGEKREGKRKSGKEAKKGKMEVLVDLEGARLAQKKKNTEEGKREESMILHHEIGKLSKEEGGASHRRREKVTKAGGERGNIV